MSDSLIEDYAELHALLDRIASKSSDACPEAEVAELAITHEHAVRKMGSIGLQRILDVSDRRRIGRFSVRSWTSSWGDVCGSPTYASGCGRSPSWPRCTR